MEYSSFSLSTSSFPLFTFNLPNRFACQLTLLNSPYHSSSFRPYFPRPLSFVFSPLHRRLECSSSKSASSFYISSGHEELESYPEAIILDIGRMTSDGTAATIKRLLDDHPQVYVTGINETLNTATVWPVNEAKVVPNWQERLGEELEKYLSSYGFQTKLRDINTFQACLENTPHSDWGYHKILSLAPLDSELKSNEKAVEALKVKVKDLLLDSTKELAKHIEFINLLCRLGASYHFEDEIDEHLHGIFNLLPELFKDNDFDLSTTANLFRLLRQHGYNATCDVFEKFKDKDGAFKKDLANDIHGILCLYEACFLAIPGEDILDEGLYFTRKHLKVFAENTSNLKLQKYITTALMFPSHKNVQYIDALNYISFYQENESANDTLLKFAKLNFNGLQLRSRKELAFLSEWWKADNFIEKFPYTRHRCVESYMFSTALFSEPEYEFGRLVTTKYTMILTVVDDTYDTCGTIEQLQLFTSALDRVTVDSGDELPKYMKNCYKIIFEDLKSNCTKGCSFSLDSKNNVAKERSYKTTYLAEMIKELAMSYFVEAKWKNDQKAPSFDEYIKNGKASSGFETCAALMILAAENMGMKEILWMRNNPPIIDASSKICRLLNDLVGHKDTKGRREFPKGVDCYMKQYGVAEDEAIEAIQKIIDDKWKVINEEMLKLKESHIPKKLLDFSRAYSRMSFAANGQADGYTYPTYLKEFLKSMLIESLPI